MKFQSQKLFVRWMLCISTGIALDAAAQSFPSNENPSDHPWRFEKISPDSDWTRHFRIGALAGLNIKADFKTTGTFAAASGTPGVYDDGYVLTDSTGNSGGLTGNWGYQNASQISGSTLLMHQTTSISAASGGASSGSSVNAGFDLAYGDSYWYWRHAKVGWEMGFDLMPVSVSGQTSVTANRDVFHFDIGGVVMPPPGYQGGFDASGENAFIGDTSLSTTTDTVSGTARENLDAMLYTLRLGPTLYWDFNQHLGLYAGAGPAVGFVSGNINSGKVILSDGTTARFSSGASGTSVIYGGYVNATLIYHAVEGGDFYLGAQFMPMSDATFSGGGQTGRLNLGGQIYVTFGINWPF